MLRLLVILNCVFGLHASRILFVIPSPSISHQVPIRPLSQELARRGHDVVVITTDPIYPEGGAPANFTEIDLHDISYKIWREAVLNADVTSGSADNSLHQITVFWDIQTQVFQAQMETNEIKNFIKGNRRFDLIFTESVSKPSLLFSHIYKVPVIQISSFPAIYDNLQVIGAAVHPILYPETFSQKLNNLTSWERLREIYMIYRFHKILDDAEVKQHSIVRKVLGEDAPTFKELSENVHMLFLNVHPFWDSNRPVPPGVVYLGGIHKNPIKLLPEDLKAYLDSSKHGVIYISYGTNVSPSALPAEKIQMLARVFSRLPYDVLWKWDKDDLPGKPKNVRISKWLPQSDLLRHPKLKVFITQGGLQSTDEAIDAGVPLIGMPMLGDQWFNVENYVKHGIGVRLDMDTLTEEKFQNAIEKVINDQSYRQNIIKLRDLINDQPQSPLERAVWWTEHILRHGGGRHLRSPAANISWTQYYEVELIAYLLAGLLLVLVIFATVIIYTVRFVSQIINTSSKLKSKEL